MSQTVKTDRQRRAEELMSVEDVAKRLDVSIKTVRRLISKGEIEVYRIGRQLRVSEGDLAHYLVRRRVF